MNSTTFFTIFSSPIDELLLTSNGTELTGLYMVEHKNSSVAIAPEWQRNDELFKDACTQLTAYFAGQPQQFDLKLAPQGTAFQKQVWQALQQIPYGQTISYGELARRINNPQAVRAVGLANGRNPISIIIPCHRVIGSNGKLVGYGGGLDRKKYLLTLETQAVNPLLPIAKD